MMKGKALKYGDNINTDIISPPQYMDPFYRRSVPVFYERGGSGFLQKGTKGGYLCGGGKLRLRIQPGDLPADFKILRDKRGSGKVFRSDFLPESDQCRNPGSSVQGCGKIREGDELDVDRIKESSGIGQGKNATAARNCRSI